MIMKTEGKLRNTRCTTGAPLAFVVLAVDRHRQPLDAATHPEIASRWFTLPNLFWFLPVRLVLG